MVYNLSAKMLSPIQVRAKRHDFFWPVNYPRHREHHPARWTRPAPRSLVHFTTDMIYGHTVTSIRMTEDHPVAPLGEYGLVEAEDRGAGGRMARQRGMRISLFRPRLIIGPGRLGILEKLFKLIDWNLPVPMIGSGRNPYQFISVFDCAEAARLAFKAGVPNEAYNLGSLNPPPVRKLLGDLIKHRRLEVAAAPDARLGGEAHARPARPPEHADHGPRAVSDRRRDVRARRRPRPERELGWVPQYRDEDMLIAAYKRIPPQEGRPCRRPHSHVPAE